MLKEGTLTYKMLNDTSHLWPWLKPIKFSNSSSFHSSQDLPSFRFLSLEISLRLLLLDENGSTNFPSPFHFTPTIIAFSLQKSFSRPCSFIGLTLTRNFRHEAVEARDHGDHTIIITTVIIVNQEININQSDNKLSIGFENFYYVRIWERDLFRYIYLYSKQTCTRGRKK